MKYRTGLFEIKLYIQYSNTFSTQLVNLMQPNHYYHLPILESWVLLQDLLHRSFTLKFTDPLPSVTERKFKRLQIVLMSGFSLFTSVFSLLSWPSSVQAFSISWLDAASLFFCGFSTGFRL